MVWTYKEYQFGKFMSSGMLHYIDWLVANWCFKEIDLLRFEIFPAVLMDV